MFRRILIATIAALALTFAAGDAEAATITVGTTADTSVGQCTLRDAITASNTNAAAGACTAGSGPSDVIDLKSLSGTITLASTLPAVGAVQSSTDIRGPGSSALTISGGNTVSILYVIGTASVSGLTIANGQCTFACGIRNEGTLSLDDVTVHGNVATVTGGTNAFPEAGGILNAGTMTLTRSTVSGNSAVASGASNQNAPQGGGIYNGAGSTLTLDRSTVSGNSAIAVAPAGGTTNINGGGIDNVGTLNVIRTTFSGNTAQASGSSTFNNAVGGAIANSNSPNVHVVIDRSTISGNIVTATGSGASNNPQAGGVNVYGAVGSFTATSSTISGNTASTGANAVFTSVANLKNTIIANPQGGQNCSGAGATSQGFNMSDGTGCGFNQATDRQNTNPQLDPSGLADNGGPTRTIALQAGSPAMDAGIAAAGETVDQRGGLRPYDAPDVANAAGGDGTDVGAYEVEDTTTPDTTIADGPADGSTITDHSPAFGLASNELATTFECRFDGAAFAACSSPAAPSAPLADGPHSFEVRAIDAASNVDATPATRAFTVATAPAENPSGDTTPPQTTITKGPKAKSRKGTAKFEFGSNEKGVTFECSFDGAKFAPCTSPLKLKHLKPGKHVFSIRAIDTAGNVDATPATQKFKRIKKTKRS